MDEFFSKFRAADSVALTTQVFGQNHEPPTEDGPNTFEALILSSREHPIEAFVLGLCFETGLGRPTFAVMMAVWGA